MTPREVREALGRELQLVTLERCTLARYGSAHDGGYLLCKNLIDDLGAVYSYGVGPNDDFDCALAARHNLPVHQDRLRPRPATGVQGRHDRLPQRVRRSEGEHHKFADVRHAGEPDQDERRQRQAADRENGRRRCRVGRTDGRTRRGAGPGRSVGYRAARRGRGTIPHRHQAAQGALPSGESELRQPHVLARCRPAARIGLQGAVGQQAAGQDRSRRPITCTAESAQRSRRPGGP